ncbi:hypothetical protein NQ318_000438, partial [Aromia moschata]
MEANTQYLEKVNVWAGIINSQIIGPYFFDGTITGARYLDFLQNFLVPECFFLLSAECIEFLIPLAKLCAFLGVIPVYDFNADKMAHRKLFKMYSLLWGISMTVAGAYGFYLRYYFLYGKGVNVVFESLLHTSAEFSKIVMFLVTTLGAAFWNTESWYKLIFQLRLLEVEVKEANRKATFLIRNTNIVLVIGSIYYLIIVTGGFLLWSVTLNLSYISTMLLFYSGFATSIMAYTIVLSIKHKFEDMNKLLLDLLKVSANDNIRPLGTFITTNICLAMKNEKIM